ncbi:hypothetical protein BCR24_06970 [Enterococcus ureilyticus]|uniref:Uncharacterized protein n=1 Tax=Enterococcus ureilyticus TaxID=1131292 RepID=A0A1E5H9J4_9ENTE|nr:hypothetical protein [Enterococcus ureilyticus]MBM7688513.1 hypothetical protein [Enterococcus ureilyticus]MBO0445650.1 hypothetical protein [Enterococcus ureilyticus]OEG21607.1 hypothetical protein BCR24_06970 [Enterococcus ureilyticus]
MEREISVAVTCKKCGKEELGKFLLNTRTDKSNQQRVNIPLGELKLSEHEIELICEDTIVGEEINLHYVCENCQTKNHVVILVTEEMR